MTKKKDGNPSQHFVLKFILNILICIFVAFVCAYLITQYVAHPTSVQGSSMEKTLQNGDQLIVQKISYYRHEPERFDVVVFEKEQHINYIKRIIGLPGEKIQIINGFIYINHKQLSEKYGNSLIEDPGIAINEIILGWDEYFVLGDNRDGSIDSRQAEVGIVKRNQITGKAWLRLYPFSKFGTIEKIK